ncbi:MAG: c-type cytochrome [Myxococcota bacterium]
MLLIGGCGKLGGMEDQPRIEPLEPSPMFDDDLSVRTYVKGTVATGDPVDPRVEQPVLTRSLMDRGRQQYDVHCAPCHGLAGYGDGMVVQRGFPEPSSYHSERLRGVTDRYIYDVIDRGLGKMMPYGTRVPPEDRWAIVAYVRALQLSQGAPFEELGPELRSKVQEGAP